MENLFSLTSILTVHWNWNSITLLDSQSILDEWSKVKKWNWDMKWLWLTTCMHANELDHINSITFQLVCKCKWFNNQIYIDGDRCCTHLCAIFDLNTLIIPLVHMISSVLYAWDVLWYQSIQSERYIYSTQMFVCESPEFY